MAQLGFQANQYQPADDFSPIPAGEYTTMMTESEVANTAKGGSMVKVTYTVMDGEFQGRKIWSQHNIVNRSSKAEEIGRREISRIAHAIGLPTLTDSDQLVNQAVRVTVIVKQDPGYDPKNEIKKWEPMNSGASVGHQPPAQQPPAQSQPVQHQAPLQGEYVPAQTQPAQQQPPAHHNTAPPWGQK